MSCVRGCIIGTKYSIGIKEDVTDIFLDRIATPDIIAQLWT